MRILRLLLLPAFVSIIWFNTIAPAFAVDTLVPCSQSSAFQQRKKDAPDTYYFNQPFESYGSELLCGEEDGLPHLPLDRPGRVIDVIIPFAIFFYVAGFIGWSGRAYLQAANKAKNPEELEIFISLPLAIPALFQGLLWPLLAVKELLSGELTLKERQIPVSPR